MESQTKKHTESTLTDDLVGLTEEEQKVWKALKQKNHNGIRVEKVQVNAKTRKLKADWTIEEVQNIESWHNPDLIEELARALAKDIDGEIFDALEESTEIIEEEKLLDEIENMPEPSKDEVWEALKKTHSYKRRLVSPGVTVSEVDHSILIKPGKLPEDMRIIDIDGNIIK